MKESKFKLHYLIYALLILEIGCLTCYQLDYFIDRYKLHFKDFNEQYRLLQIITVITILVVCVDLYKRFWMFIFVIGFSSCKVKGKLVEPTIYWSVDSLENIEEHLYNEWE